MVRILHLADLHLGWQPKTPTGNERRAERDQLLGKAAEFAREQGVQLLVIAGDLFETHHPEAPLVNRVKDCLGQLIQAGIQVLTVPGNHDEITYSDSVYHRDWPGLLVRTPQPQALAPVQVAGETLHIYSMAYTAGLTKTPIDQLPPRCAGGVHLGVFHASLNWDAGERALPLTASAVEKSGYDYLALGHIHQHKRQRLGKTWACYPGAIEGKSPHDPGVGHFTVVDLSAGEVRMTTHPIWVRPHRLVTVDLGGFESLGDLHDWGARNQDAQAIVEVRLAGLAPGPIEPDALVKEWREFFYHLEVTDDSQGIADEFIGQWAEEPTIRGAFVRKMVAAIEGADQAERRGLERALRLGLTHLAKGG